MKKKTTEISINTSSGAEKVEKIQEKLTTEPVKKTTVKKEKSAKKEAALGGMAAEIKKANANSTDGRAEKESEAAKARVEEALERKEEQARKKADRKARMEKKEAVRKKRMAEKKAAIAKREAEKKAKAEKHAADRKALAEKRKAEKEEKLRQRAHAKANKNNANYTKKKQKAKAKSERSSHREGEKGYGGWIAAVVSLGIVSLALATTVTVGAVEMNKSNTAMMSSYRGTMYELTGVMENMDGDLDRVRISNSPVQQSRILTDLLVQARLAELDLEKLPVAAEVDRNATAHVNRTAKECERMLTKLRNGEPLSKEDLQSLETLYQIHHTVRAELNEMVKGMTDKDWAEYLKKGAGRVKDGFDKIEKSTLQENRENFGEKTEGAGMKPSAPTAAEGKEMPHIEAAVAEALCADYFTGYNVSDFQCIGETVSKGYEAYNVQGYDEKGNQLFAEISQKDGALLRFDYYEDCMGDTFDVYNAEKIAEEFLEKLGYDDMEVVRVRDNGSNSDFTFVYEEDDVAYYPDEIRVKVCRTRGVVSGFDATKYLQNHRGRVETKAKISLADAKEKLHKALRVENARKVVIDTSRGERTAYEFVCSYEEEEYFVFVDAITGEEISIVNRKTVC